MKRFTYISCIALLGCSVHVFAQGERSLLWRENPEYPPIAIRMNLHGTVKLRIWITPEGAVRRLEYVGGHPLLAEPALKAVRNWKFESSAKETTQIVDVKF